MYIVLCALPDNLPLVSIAKCEREKEGDNKRAIYRYIHESMGRNCCMYA